MKCSNKCTKRSGRVIAVDCSGMEIDSKWLVETSKTIHQALEMRENFMKVLICILANKKVYANHNHTVDCRV